MESIAVLPHARSATVGELLDFLIAYVDLLVARWEAHSPEDHAVALRSMQEKDIPRYVLLWMLYQNHIQHLERVSGHERHGQPTGSLRLTEASSFALTASGESFANRFLILALSDHDADFANALNLLPLGSLLPRYQPDGRVFTWGRHVVKSFRQPSHNQELILQSAEELGWPDWFDDPLPRTGRVDPKVRLHDTIKDLNRRQLVSLIRFKGDGTGSRIGWELR